MRSDKEFSVRKGTLADAKGILRCLEQAFAPYRDSYTPLAYADTVLTEATLRVRFTGMETAVSGDLHGCIADVRCICAEC